MKYLSVSQIRFIQSLKKRKDRYQTRMFWVEGERILREFIEHGVHPEFYVISEKKDDIISSSPAEVPIFLIKERDVSRIKSTQSFPGIGAVFSMPDEKPLTSKTIIALDKINDPGNLGTIFRTALWFGFNEFLSDEESADPFNEKTVRSSMGAIAGINLILCNDFGASLKRFQQKGYTLVALDVNGVPLTAQIPEKRILIFGNEANGISEQILNICDLKLTIPGNPNKIESLNVGIAFGITSYVLASFSE